MVARRKFASDDVLGKHLCYSNPAKYVLPKHTANSKFAPRLSGKPFFDEVKTFFVETNFTNLKLLVQASCYQNTNKWQALQLSGLQS